MFQPPFGPRHYLVGGKGLWKLYQRGTGAPVRCYRDSQGG